MYNIIHTKHLIIFRSFATLQCDICEAVYHKACKTPLVPCPRCKRIRQRNALLGDQTDNDYSYSMEV